MGFDKFLVFLCHKQVLRIIPHEGYAASITTNIIKDNIALIELKADARFSATVSTVCIWSGSDDEAYIAGKTGTVKSTLLFHIIYIMMMLTLYCYICLSKGGRMGIRKL